jgi:uncharacterized protein YutE (UPF0331/DUF86 family)
MKLDPEVLQGKIDLIEEHLDLLKELAKRDYEEFIDERRNVLAAKHALQESIEACLDIGNHIISRKGFRRPDDYKGIFSVLKEEEILEGNLANNLVEMAKFRNLLVHMYGDVDNRKLFSILQNNLNDFKGFIKAILGTFTE